MCLHFAVYLFILLGTSDRSWHTFLAICKFCMPHFGFACFRLAYISEDSLVLYASSYLCKLTVGIRFWQFAHFVCPVLSLLAFGWHTFRQICSFCMPRLAFAGFRLAYVSANLLVLYASFCLCWLSVGIRFGKFACFVCLVLLLLAFGRHTFPQICSFCMPRLVFRNLVTLRANNAVYFFNFV